MPVWLHLLQDADEWRHCFLLQKKFPHELHHQDDDPSRQAFKFNIFNEILLAELDNEDFNKNVENFILKKNKEIILDSQEILLSISTNKKPNIFFINSCFIKNLLALNYSLNEKQQTTGDLNEEIKELETSCRENWK